MEHKHNKPLFCCLDLPSEQQLVIKLTSQQAHALALASRCIVGYQVKKQGRHRPVPAALALRNGNSRRSTVLLKGQPSNPWQPWRTETDLLFVFDVVPLSHHIHPEDQTEVRAKPVDRHRGCDTFHCSEALLAPSITRMGRAPAPGK
ncbi:hypothetical protein NQZ68_026754 [Dissostichus eleginoides]|nr:hypothetical protein NQZ68_026754 [Dissostichus eleginoides]